MSLDTRLAQRLAKLDAAGLSRTLPATVARDGVNYSLHTGPVTGFCSNDYLGLGTRTLPGAPLPGGATGSRLISGDLPIHRQLERELADLAGYDDAVLFPSGFQLNVGVLPCLLEADDRVYSDALNHASIIDGLRLASPRPQILAHGSPPPTTAADAANWWITESIYSMDGDLLNTEALQTHLNHGGYAYIDEAHALGLYPHGAGLLGTATLPPTLLVGTLSKAYGCAGAFVASTSTVCHYIRTRARSFVFTTGPSPVLCDAMRSRLALVRGPQGDALRTRLWDNVALLSAELGLTEHARSPIFPLMIGDNTLATTAAASLAARGWHVQAIRPPTVPVGTARLRLTVSAVHTSAQIRGLATALREVFAAADLPLALARGSHLALPTPSAAE